MFLLKISLIILLLSIPIFSDASSSNLNWRNRNFRYGAKGCDPKFYEYTRNYSFFI
jgi:hypothetical protein